MQHLGQVIQSFPKTQNLFSLLDRACEVAIRRASDIRLPANDEAFAIGVQLHVRIIELIDACRVLLHSGHHAAVPVLNRTVYEALVDQTAIATDPMHAKGMAVSSVREARGFPDVLRRGNGDVIKAFVAKAGARDFMRFFKAHEVSLAAQNIETMGIEEKFTAAGMPSEYSMFRLLSGSVHNDGGDLQRHVEVEGDGTRRVTLFAAPNIETLDMQLYLAAGNLIRSCRVVHGESDSELSALFNEIVLSMERSGSPPE